MADAVKKRKRSCIGCGKQADKRDLLRIVRTPEGVRFDATGRVAGRGAYVCSPECFRTAWEAHRLQRALKTNIEDVDGARIASELSSAVREAQR